MFMLAQTDQPVLDFKPTFEFRERYERRTDKDFNKSVDDGSSQIVSRVRIGVDFSYGKDVTGRVQYRYAHNYFFAKPEDYTDDRTDVDQAYIVLKAADGKLKLGRQDMVKGTEKLLGGGNFGQITKTWDGIRYTNKKLDAFAGKLEVDTKMYPAAWMGMVAYTTRLGETMLVAKQDEATVKDVEIYTVDHRYTGKRGKWTFAGEGALQFGRNQAKDVQAWAGHGKVEYQLCGPVSVFAEANVASGGSSATKDLTFDQLFAANHNHYGQMDMQGWRNVQHLEFGLNYKPDKKLNVGLQAHFFELYDAKDGWYGAGGSVNKRVGGTYKDAAGFSGRDLGQELNLCGTYQWDKHLQLQFGVGAFTPGGFQKSFDGTDSRTQYWGYFGVTGKY